MRSFRPALIVLPFLALAACSGEPEQPAPEGPDTNLIIDEASPEPLPTPEPLPEPSPTPSPTPTFEAAPPPKVDEEQQMLADAEATGMTARVERGDRSERAERPSRDGEPENLLPPSIPAER